MVEILSSIWSVLVSITSAFVMVFNMAFNVLSIVPPAIIRITNYTSMIFGSSMGSVLILLAGFVTLGIVVNLLLQLL